MWDRFDAVAVLCSTNRLHRQDSIRAELSRVGLAGRVSWFWDFDNPFMVRLAHNIRLASDVRDISCFRATMNHYRAVKTLLELGHSHVLVLEDDVRFLRDLDALSASLSAMPADYDMAKLEWTGHLSRGKRSLPDIEGPWSRLSGFDTRCAAAIAYSANGMRWRAGKIETCADMSNLFSELHAVDVYDNAASTARLHAYVSSPLVAVQDLSCDGEVGRDTRTYSMYGKYLAHGGSSAYAVA
jgi:hypothetical protein